MPAGLLPGCFQERAFLFLYSDFQHSTDFKAEVVVEVGSFVALDDEVEFGGEHNIFFNKLCAYTENPSFNRSEKWEAYNWKLIEIIKQYLYTE